MRCTPDECGHCLPWGPDVCGGSKVRCVKPPVNDACGFRFSTALGARCIIAAEIARGVQGELFESQDASG